MKIITHCLSSFIIDSDLYIPAKWWTLDYPR